MKTTRTKELVELVRSAAEDGAEFYYLGAPMSNIEKFNFPAVEAAAERLRAHGYLLAVPTEMDDPAIRAQALASTDGDISKLVGEGYGTMLARDLMVISLPNCVGGIFLPGWHRSRGALEESKLVAFYEKQLLEYHDDPDGVTLRIVEDREKRIKQLRAIDHAEKATD